MDKKGQVTAFIIVGIVIFAAFGLLMLFKGEVIQSYLNSQLSKSSVSPEVEPINEYVLDCLESTVYDGLFVIGQQGGYFNVPEVSTDFGIPYYFYMNDSYFPKLDVIEKQLSLYVYEELENCINGFSNFTGFNVESGEIRVKTEAKENKTVVKVGYPLKIIRNDVEFEMKNFEVEVPIRLGAIYRVANELVENQLEDPEYICLTCIFNLTEKETVFIDMADYVGNIVIFIITDPNSMMEGYYYFPETEPQHYRFLFAMKYG